jgi:hypothetical protein
MSRLDPKYQYTIILPKVKNGNVTTLQNIGLLINLTSNKMGGKKAVCDQLKKPCVPLMYINPLTPNDL